MGAGEVGAIVEAVGCIVGACVGPVGVPVGATVGAIVALTAGDTGACVVVVLESLLAPPPDFLLHFGMPKAITKITHSTAREMPRQ